MCTVTFIPLENKNFVLTSNRDEAPNRTTVPPRNDSSERVMLLAPKDALAGGTWIGSSTKKRTLCILNGGFTMHKRSPDFTQSRGLVVKELLVTDDLFAAVESADYTKVEPFTLVIVTYENELQLHQLVWDGVNKHFEKLPNKPTIWSSSTLYSEQMKRERKAWFEDFKKSTQLSAQSLLDFHWNTAKENQEYGVIMDRFFVKTKSTTQVEKMDNIINMRYYDLLNDQHYSEQLQVVQEVE